jgi:cytochrome P450 family 6
MGAHLVQLKGSKWRIVRSKLTPSFTSSKMKMMFNLMTECAEQLQQYLDKPARNGDILEIKDIMARFTTDVTCSCVFGINCNSIRDPNSEFRKMGKHIIEQSFGIHLQKFLRSFSSFLLKLFHVRQHSDKVSNFFMRVVKEVIDYREKNNVVRNDLIQLLVQLKNKGKIEDDGDNKSEHVQNETAGKETEENIGECIIDAILMYNVTVSTEKVQS